MKEHLAHVGLLIIGDEILLGRRADKHFPHALQYFKGFGIDIGWVHYLGDSAPLLVEQLKAIKARGEVCFCFGGIGATPDDLTRQSMALAHGLELVRHPEAAACIEDTFGSEAYPNRILMADLPAGAELIPNGYNNIPGFSLGTIFCLPGFPEMAWSMMEWVMQSRFVGPERPDCFFRFFVVGARESELIKLLETAQKHYPDVKISSLPRFPGNGEWRIELGARGVEVQVQQVITLLQTELRAMGYRIDNSQS